MTSLPPRSDESGGMPCTWCDGDGEAANPANADPAVAIVDLHPPVQCPRCGGTGVDPDGHVEYVVFTRPECIWRYCPTPRGCQQACAHPRPEARDA
jgi:hypothetical protein